MYRYSDLPPTENPNNQGNPPPYNYNQNPHTQGNYPPYNYQNIPGQYYYPPQPPTRPNGYPMLRAIGLIMLVLFVLALVGHRGFFFGPLIIVGIVLLVNRHRFGGYRGHSHRFNRYNRWQNSYPQQQYYDYNQAAQQPGYSYPPQPQAPTYNPGWPAPNGGAKTDNPL